MNLKTLSAALLVAACAVPAATATLDVSVSTSAVECLSGSYTTHTQPGVSYHGCAVQVRDGPHAYEAYCAPLGAHSVQPSVSTSGCELTVRA